jgi:hypothetical protein
MTYADFCEIYQKFIKSPFQSSLETLCFVGFAVVLAIIFDKLDRRKTKDKKR